MTTTRYILLLGIIIALGVGVRLWNVDGQSLTMDELEELEVARRSGTAVEILEGARRFPPLYHLSLRGVLAWRDTDVAARLLSVAFGILTLWIMAGVGSHLLGRKAGLIIAALVALSPFHVWYSQETRVYGLYLLCAAGALWGLFRGLEKPDGKPWGWLALGIGCIAGLYTHYYFGLLVVVTGLVTLMHPRRRAAGRPWLTTMICVCICAAPGLWLLQRDLSHSWGFSQHSAFDLPALGYTYLSILTGYTLGPSLRDLHTLDFADAFRLFAPWLVVIGLIATPLMMAGWRALPGRHRAGLLALGIVPVLAVGGLSVSGPFGYNVRHVAWVSLPLLLWLGAGLASLPRGGWLLGIALVAVNLTALHNRHYDPAHRNEDTRAACAYVAEHARAGARVFVISGYVADPVRYYAAAPERVHALPDIAATGEGLGEACRLIRSTTPPGDDFWLLTSRTFHGDPGSLLLAELGPAGVELEARFAGVAVHRGRQP